jgi:SAM-dependent methyltransferase
VLARIEIINFAVSAFAQAFSARGAVLDIGSRYEPGYEGVCDRRALFPGRQFIGCDLRSGSGVDRIENAERLSFADASLGTVLILETMEHLPNPERAVSEAHRVLADDGVLLVSVPFNYRLHGFPTDYWRFTASGLHGMLTEFPQSLVFAVGPRVKPDTVFAVARKRNTPSFRFERERFRALLASSKSLQRRLFFTALQDRTRDFFGLLLGRADVGVAYYDPSEPGGYVFEVGQRQHITDAKERPRTSGSIGGIRPGSGER